MGGLEMTACDTGFNGMATGVSLAFDGRNAVGEVVERELLNAESDGTKLTVGGGAVITGCNCCEGTVVSL